MNPECCRHGVTGVRHDLVTGQQQTGKSGTKREVILIGGLTNLGKSGSPGLASY